MTFPIRTCFLLAVASASGAYGAVTFQPATPSGDWFTASNWIGGVVAGPGDLVSIAAGKTATITSADAAGGSLFLNDQSTVAISAGGTGLFTGLLMGLDTLNTTSTITIDGLGSTLSSTGVNHLSYFGNTTSTIHARNGGSLTTSGITYMGRSTGAISNILVESGASYNAAGTLYIGYNAGTSGYLTVTGSGSKLTASDDTLHIGYFGHGSFTLADGATADTRSVSFSNRAGTGTGTWGSEGLVSGAGTAWNITGTLLIGSSSRSSLTIANGATVTPTGVVGIAHGSTLSIGNGDNAGTLAAASVVFDGYETLTTTPVPELVFNHSDTITFSAAITGFGRVVKDGSGTVVLSGANSYSGRTDLNRGTVRLGRANALGAPYAQVVRFAGGTLDLAGFNQTIATLELTANSSVRFDGTSTLFIIATGSGDGWSETAMLTLENFTVGSNQVYITPSIGFTSAHLSQFRLAGYTIEHGSNGYLTFTAIPEPATWASLAGAGVLALTLLRRHRSPRA